MSTRPSPASRGLVRLSALAALVVTFVLAAVPAYADERPVGWEDPTSVDPLRVLLVFVVAPLGAALLIALLTAAPWFVRGEGLGSDPERRAIEPAPGEGAAELGTPHRD